MEAAAEAPEQFSPKARYSISSKGFRHPHLQKPEALLYQKSQTLIKKNDREMVDANQNNAEISYEIKRKNNDFFVDYLRIPELTPCLKHGRQIVEY